MTIKHQGGHVARTLLDEHVCDAMVLGCIDFRFWEALFSFVRQRFGIDRFDPLILAGGAKNLASPALSAMPEVTFFNIDVSHRLHHIKHVVVTNHIDCGAYGGSAKFAGKEEEIAFHKQELEKAARLIAEKYPDLKIIKVFASRRGEEPEFLVFE